MQILLMLFALPVIWGIIGVCRGRLPISTKLEIVSPHHKPLAVLLIVIPLIVFATSVALYFAIRPYVLGTENLLWYILSGDWILLATLFAFLFARAKRLGVPIRSSFANDRPNFSIPEADSKTPNFENIREQMRDVDESQE